MINKTKLLSLFVVITLLVLGLASPTNASSHDVVTNMKHDIKVLEWEYEDVIRDYSFNIKGYHSAEFDGVINSPPRVESGSTNSIGYTLIAHDDLFTFVLSFTFGEQTVEAEIPLESDFFSAHLVETDVSVPLPPMPHVAITLSYDITLVGSLSMQLGIDSNNLKNYNWESTGSISHDFTFPDVTTKQPVEIGHYGEKPSANIEIIHTISIGVSVAGIPVGEVPVYEDENVITEILPNMCGAVDNRASVFVYPEPIDTTTDDEYVTSPLVIATIVIVVGVIVIFAVVQYRRKGTNWSDS